MTIVMNGWYMVVVRNISILAELDDGTIETRTPLIFDGKKHQTPRFPVDFPINPLNTWRFPEMGVSPVIIHFHGFFPKKTPPTCLEDTPQISSHARPRWTTWCRRPSWWSATFSGSIRGSASVDSIPRAAEVLKTWDTLVIWHSEHSEPGHFFWIWYDLIELSINYMLICEKVIC